MLRKLRKIRRIWQVKLNKIRRFLTQRKLTRSRKREPWKKWRINRSKTSKSATSTTLINHLKYKKCIIINQEARSLWAKSHRTTRRKFPRLRLRFRLRKLSKMTTSMRIFTFLRKKRNYMMIPPILEEVRVTDLNLIPLRYPRDYVYLTERKSPSPKKRLRDQNLI